MKQKNKSQLWLDPEVKREIKIKAAELDMTMQEYLKEVLKKTKKIKIKGDEFDF